MAFKCKITEADVTTSLSSEELIKLGYRRVSNAYCLVARIDREDWLDVLALARGCSVADFYSKDGSGVSDRHRDYYCRVHSKDELTVHPSQIRQIPTW